VLFKDTLDVCALAALTLFLAIVGANTFHLIGIGIHARQIK
jgi:hypothetical protein